MEVLVKVCVVEKKGAGPEALEVAFKLMNVGFVGRLE